jgi:hypothetical protein
MDISSSRRILATEAYRILRLGDLEKNNALEGKAPDGVRLVARRRLHDT